MRPARQSKLLNAPVLGMIIKFFLLIPHFIMLMLLAYAAFAAWWLSTWAILFTGRYPRGLFRLISGVMRWAFGVTAYVYSLFDEYPPMDLEQRQDRELILEADYPSAPSRLLNLPFLPLKVILAIPHLLILYGLGLAAALCVLIGQFAILFGGTFPRGLHTFVTGTTRWSVRLYGYLAGFTDDYPPFSLD